MSSYSDFESGKGAAAPAPVAKTEETTPTPAAPVVSTTTSTKASILTPIARHAKNKLTSAPVPYEFSLGHPTGLSACDVDIIKLTAQFTAVNGRDFLGRKEMS